jgi:hypothetical protein
MRILALIAALLTFAGPACAAHWKPVRVTPADSIYIDMDALVRSGNKVQGWDWQKFASGQTSATWQGTFFWVKSLTSYNCTQRTTDALLKIYLGNDGVELKRAYLEGLQFPATVEPDSLREKLYEMACNPPKSVTKPVAATKPTAEVASAQSKGVESTSAGVGVPAKTYIDLPAYSLLKADSKPAKAGEKVGVAAKEHPAKPAAKQQKKPNQLKTVGHPAHARMISRKSLIPAKKTKLHPDPACPPVEQVAAPMPVPPVAPSPQITDAGNNGVFN